MACPHNLANNRQTRMLADLSLIGCYNSSLNSRDRDRLMLNSAKHNLKLMPFFMLTEYQKVILNIDVMECILFLLNCMILLGWTIFVRGNIWDAICC